MSPRVIRCRQRGVAMLAAVLLVALGTMLATAIAFHSGMMARRATATFAFEQALLVAQGAEALAAYVLREDARSDARGGVARDHLQEPWAQPVGPVEIIPGVVLEAGLTDLQGRFNLNSLVDAQGQRDPVAMEIFERLLAKLGLEEKWAELIADWIDANIATEDFDGAEDGTYTAFDPPYRTPNTLITSPSELLALPEFGRERYLRLAPYVTALPRDATINVCTASAALLDAMIGPAYEEFSRDPENLSRQREEDGCWPTADDFRQVLESEERDEQLRQAIAQRVGEDSKYYRLTSVVTIGTTQIALYSLLLHEQNGTRVIQRSYSPD
ncbi:MAG: type II secretion system minor pseudopilin GspK [Pseudomonadota bacterium]|nr:MAG: hypothetical protein DIU56_04505 [Pseudomonadota bacterium]